MAKKFVIDIDSPQRMIPNVLHDSLTLLTKQQQTQVKICIWAPLDIIQRLPCECYLSLYCLHKSINNLWNTDQVWPIFIQSISENQEAMKLEKQPKKCTGIWSIKWAFWALEWTWLRWTRWKSFPEEKSNHLCDQVQDAQINKSINQCTNKISKSKHIHAYSPFWF